MEFIILSIEEQPQNEDIRQSTNMNTTTTTTATILPAWVLHQQQQQQEQEQEQQSRLVDEYRTEIENVEMMKYQFELTFHDLSLRKVHVLNESNLRRANLRRIAKQTRNPRRSCRPSLRRDEVLAIEHDTRVTKQELTAYVYLEACTRREMDFVQQQISELLRTKQLLEKEREALLKHALRKHDFFNYSSSNNSSEETKDRCHDEYEQDDDDDGNDDMPFQSLVAGLLMM